MKVTLSSLLLFTLLLAVTLASAMDQSQEDTFEGSPVHANNHPRNPNSPPSFNQGSSKRPGVLSSLHGRVSKVAHDVTKHAQPHVESVWHYVTDVYHWLWSLVTYAGYSLGMMKSHSEVKPVPILIIAATSLAVHFWYSMSLGNNLFCIVGQGVIIAIDAFFRKHGHQTFSCNYSMFFPLMSLFSHLAMLAFHMDMYMSLIPGGVVAYLALMACSH